MQFKFLTVLASLGLLAVATPNEAPQCTSGSLECCDSIGSSSDPVISQLLGLLGISVGPVAIPIGVTCSAVTVGAGGEASCSETLVCCENNSFNGVVALGCSPVSVGV